MSFTGPGKQEGTKNNSECGIVTMHHVTQFPASEIGVKISTRGYGSKTQAECVFSFGNMTIKLTKKGVKELLNKLENIDDRMNEAIKFERAEQERMEKEYKINGIKLE